MKISVTATSGVGTAELGKIEGEIGIFNAIVIAITMMNMTMMLTLVKVVVVVEVKLGMIVNVTDCKNNNKQCW